MKDKQFINILGKATAIAAEAQLDFDNLQQDIVTWNNKLSGIENRLITVASATDALLVSPEQQTKKFTAEVIATYRINEQIKKDLKKQIEEASIKQQEQINSLEKQLQETVIPALEKLESNGNLNTKIIQEHITKAKDYLSKSNASLDNFSQTLADFYKGMEPITKKLQTLNLPKTLKSTEYQVKLLTTSLDKLKQSLESTPLCKEQIERFYPLEQAMSTLIQKSADLKLQPAP